MIRSHVCTHADGQIGGDVVRCMRACVWSQRTEFQIGHVSVAHHISPRTHVQHCTIVLRNYCLHNELRMCITTTTVARSTDNTFSIDTCAVMCNRIWSAYELCLICWLWVNLCLGWLLQSFARLCAGSCIHWLLLRCANFATWSLLTCLNTHTILIGWNIRFRSD